MRTMTFTTTKTMTITSIVATTMTMMTMLKSTGYKHDDDNLTVVRIYELTTTMSKK
jgi:hypothetical protein